jgi:hypothetical protein
MGDQRRGRFARRTDSSLIAQQAVRDAEAVVCLAWAEELLRRHDCTAVAADAARQEYQAASDRFAAARHCGDPGRISLAHAMLQDAMEVHHAGEVASDRVRRDLEAVLGALARTRKAYLVAGRAPWRVGRPRARRTPGPGRP